MGRQNGLTLMELIIVVIIIGILASVAVPRYVTVVEKGRSAEARRVMGMIRTAQEAYKFEQQFFASSLSCLSVSVPTSCDASSYFSYSITGNATAYNITASRCTANGKSPNAAQAYALNMTEGGTLGATNTSYL